MEFRCRLASPSGEITEGIYAAESESRLRHELEAFLDALHRSVAHGCPEGASRSEVARYLAALHVGDLALACACRAGVGEAWDHLVLEVRPALYAAARSVAGDGYRELADSLYAELYGVSTAGQARTSLLAWFHGRSRLVTWLRSVLVQRHIDARRAASRIEQWDADEEDRKPDQEDQTRTTETQRKQKRRKD